MQEYSTYHDDLEYCKQFLFSFGSNYSLATKLFPKKARESTLIWYSFLRYADEIVDNPTDKLPGQTHQNLDQFMDEWRKVIETGKFREAHPIVRANHQLFTQYGIPFDYTFDFLDVMQQDLTKSRYKTYAELEHYMWGSASVVGHVMTFIVGYTDRVAFDHARALGEAMQLANFLRDVDEDYQDRDRIYLPENDMQVFGVTE